MRCPACPDTPLKEQLTRKGVLVDACPKCRGVWLDGGELYPFARDPGLLEREVQSCLPKAEESPRRCPRCDRAMREARLLRDDLPVEVCPECEGMWFDQGELQKVLSEARYLRGMEPDAVGREPDRPPAAAETAERDARPRERLAAIASGLTPLPNLFVRSAWVLFLLYGLLTLVIIALVETEMLSLPAGIAVGVGFAALQFTLGPWMMDLTLRWLYAFSWVRPEELPGHLRDFAERVCREQNMRFPWFGLIHDGAPNAFTYGHTPNNMRIVLTQGVHDLLEPEEVEAVVAHEIGHGKHWDMLLMTVAQLVPLLAYFFYRVLIRARGGRGDKGGGTRVALAVGAYVVYIVSQYLVLWFSRCREYHADRFAGDVTGNPNALASALVKIAYGLAARAGEPPEGEGDNDRDRQEKRAGGVAAIGALGIFDAQAAQRLVVSASGADPDGAHVGPENLKSAMQWDLWNPWARWYEIHSTHPLVAHRLQYLAEQSAALGREPYVVFDRRKPESYWDEFLIDVSVLMLPWLFLLAGVAVVAAALARGGIDAAGWWMLGPPMVGVSLGGLLRLMFTHRADRFARSTVAGLLHRVKVSAVRPVPARVKGVIIGRGVPGLIWSEDFVMKDRTGILFLDYRQPLRIWDFLFGLLRARDYTGKKVEVTGWFRRAPVPYLEILELTDQSGRTRRAYTYHASIVGGYSSRWPGRRCGCSGDRRERPRAERRGLPPPWYRPKPFEGVRRGKRMIEIDGSFGEGGGQILRSSLALALVTGKPFRMVHIRARRPKPGLQPQHLTAVRAAAEVGRARLRGDAIGSQELTFEPGGVEPGNYRFAIGTAGATGLVLQTVYLPLAWKAGGVSEVILEGGTHVMASPCYHFLAVTWRRYLERMGMRVELDLDRPGFYPRGGGRVRARVFPCGAVRGLSLTSCPPVTTARGFSAVAGLPEHIARRQARRATVRLADGGIEAAITLEQWQGGPGSVLAVVLDQTPVPTLFFGLGARGKPAEAVADEAAEQALAHARSGAPVDLHSADQIVLPLALADGPSEFRTAEVTRHLITNVAVIRNFLDREITVEGAEGSTGVVRIAPGEL
ncbi:MAG TPA: RNA 3'-terminal phosphate cyclase [Gemmataceae bacterium]